MLSFTVTGTYITISHRAPLAWILFKLTSLLQVYLGSHGFYGEDGEQERRPRLEPAVGRGGTASELGEHDGVREAVDRRPQLKHPIFLETPLEG